MPNTNNRWIRVIYTSNFTRFQYLSKTIFTQLEPRRVLHQCLYVVLLDLDCLLLALFRLLAHLLVYLARRVLSSQYRMMQWMSLTIGWLLELETLLHSREFFRRFRHCNHFPFGRVLNCPLGFCVVAFALFSFHLYPFTRGSRLELLRDRGLLNRSLLHLQARGHLYRNVILTVLVLIGFLDQKVVLNVGHDVFFKRLVFVLIVLAERLVSEILLKSHSACGLLGEKLFAFVGNDRNVVIGANSHDILLLPFPLLATAPVCESVPHGPPPEKFPFGFLIGLVYFPVNVRQYNL